ncbi:MAG: acetoin utilization protein AcuC [Brachybacterium sp.]|nr:acetoin utilization protein AcuC [Brachybacterium sp.]
MDGDTGHAAATATGIVWDDTLLHYDFGAGHPMSPVRLELTWELLRARGLLDHPAMVLLDAPVAADADLARAHTRDLIDAVRAASDPATRPSPAALYPYGLDSEDTPIFDGMHTAAARIVGGAQEAMRAIRRGTVRRAVHFAGGMHHARSSQVAGFCVYNDAAIAIAEALEDGEQRIAYVDLDVHHGDGVERALWDDPRAVTISLHQSGETLFPGTGFVQDTGGPNAPGSAINIPLPPRIDSSGWLRAIEATILPLVRAIRPTVLVTQHGADTHRDDPLAEMHVTLEAQRESMRMMRSLADEVTGGRWLALGGGGYAVTDVVPRSWAHLVAIALGDDIPADAPLPESYVPHATELAHRHGVAPPQHITTFGDRVPLVRRDWSRTGFDPEDDLDRAIQAARRTAFPDWGLDPYLD